MRVYLRLGAVLTVVLILGPALEFGSLATTRAWAAEESEPPRKTRRVPSMSEATFKKLAEAQELMDAEPKDLDGAIRVLNGMLDRSRRYNGNEIGQIHNMLGFAYFAKEDYGRAITHYEVVINQGDDITEGLETTTLYTLAQLNFVDENYSDALRYMQIWLSKANNPGPEPHIFMGQVYYQMEDYRNSAIQIEKGVAIAQGRGTPVKENWWALLSFLYSEQELWPKVLEVLETLVREFPKRSYWVSLAGIQGQQGMEKEQVYTMMAAYDAGYLTMQSDLVTLAGLLMQEEVPIRAAAVLQKALDDKTVERSERNLRSLGQSYQLAQEVDKAIPVFEDAAKVSDDGRIYERLAQLYMEADNFDHCVEAASNALQKGGLRQVQSVYVLRGMCEYNRDGLTRARESFVSCRNESRRVKDQGNLRICQQWITYISREVARRRAIANAI